MVSWEFAPKVASRVPFPDASNDPQPLRQLLRIARGPVFTPSMAGHQDMD